jgi:glyoxylate reductase
MENARMKKPVVFVARHIPPTKLALLQENCDVDLWDEELPPPHDVLLARSAGKDGILSLLTDMIDAEVMDAAGSELKVISNCAVGYDNIDVGEATARSLPVGNTPGVLTDSTADFAFGLLMAAGRRIVEGEQYVRAGSWKTWGLTTLLGEDISGATLGIIGFGRIGRRVAKRGRGFDMRVLYYDPLCQDDPYAMQIGAECVDYETLLRESDFITLHMALNDETYHMINAETLSKMKPDAILVNTARGAVVDQEALYHALKNRVIRAAAVDVTDPEPLPLDHPLLRLDNLIVTPHIASATVKTRYKMVQIAIDNLLAGLSGAKLPHCINPEVYA